MSTASGLPAEDLASKLLGTKGRGGLEAFFTPQNIAVIGATEKAGSIGRTIVLEPDEKPVRRAHLPRQPEAAERAGDQRPIRASGTCPTWWIWPSWSRPRRRCRT